MQGIITKGIGGFYYVEAAEAIYECKAKGRFRREGITPLAGDRVNITLHDNAENTIDEILPRKNSLVRPPVANIDRLFVVSSVSEPNPSLLIIDKLIAMAEKRDIEPVIIFTKTDLAPSIEFERIYSKAGFRTFSLSTKEPCDLSELVGLLSGKVTALCGNTGVGKSSLLNMICPERQLATGEISRKLGRGRHTTRQAELFKVAGGYVVDTAGFSTVNILEGEAFLSAELPLYFRDFEPYLGRCRFTSCSHVADKGCAVCEAVEAGEISPSRHESYVAIYNEIKDLKQWQL